MKFSSFIFLIHFLITILLILFGLLYSNLVLDSGDFIYAVSVIAILLFVWVIWSWKKIAKEIFSPYILFFLASMFFNLGHSFLIVMGFEDKYLNGVFSNDDIIKTVYLVILCHSFLHLGALISLLVKHKRIKSWNIDIYNVNDNNSIYISYVGWVLFVIAIVPTFIKFNEAVTVVLTSGYIGIYQQESLVGFANATSVLANLLIPAVLFLLAGSKSDYGHIRKINLIVAVISTVLYTTSGFFIGNRSGPVLFLLAFAWVWHKTIKPIPKTVLLTAGFILLVVLFPVIAILRSNIGEERFSLSNIWNALTSIDNPLVAILKEMGTSMNTITYTMNLIPTVRPYDLGEGYLMALTTIFPNLFWEIHPAVERGKFADWLIWNVDPITAQNGGGLGFSYIAEAYANFGYFGAPVVIFLFGILIVRLILWAEFSNDKRKIAMVGSFLAFLLFVVRDEAASIIRPLIWYAMIPYFGVILLKKLFRINYKKLN